MDEQFIKDTIRQLKCGLKCYVFNDKMAYEINAIYKKKTGYNLKAYRIDKDYIMLKPVVKITKYYCY